MSPTAPDTETAMRMLPLLDRGREALHAHLASLPAVARPMVVGNSLSVVTEADYVANAILLLRHVCRNGAPTHILCTDGHLCALLEHLPEKW